jgi:glycosyltransferase involved in cell wall biosynthesis
MTLPATIDQLRMRLEDAQALFLVWGPPSHGPRSRVLAKKLGIDAIFIEGARRRGLVAAPMKYPLQTVKTLRLLATRKPQIAFVQSPPSFAPLVLALFGRVTSTRFIVDGHSDAFQAFYWTRPRWLFRWIYRSAMVTIVTNEAMAADLESFGATTLILRDVPTEFPGTGSTYDVPDGFNIAVVSTYASDEPLAEVLDAARTSPHVTFHVTGKLKNAPQELVTDAASNIVFTDYLPDEQYYDLLRSCDAVMCLTTRDNTMQRGACEALSLARPVITSDWPLLRTYFREGAIFVQPSSESISHGVETAAASKDVLTAQMVEMKKHQAKDWQRGLEQLDRLVEGTKP